MDWLIPGFCAVSMSVYAILGAWMFRIATEHDRPLLQLLGLWAGGNAAQILLHLVAKATSQLPELAFLLGDPNPAVNALTMELSIGTTICLAWAGFLAREGNLAKPLSTGSFSGWIGAGAALLALLVLSDFRAVSKPFDTLTTLLAISFMSAGLAWLGKGSSEKILCRLCWTGAVLWMVHGIYELTWYIAEDKGIQAAYVSKPLLLGVNVIGVVPTVAAAIITAQVIRRLSGRGPPARVRQYRGRDLRPA